MTTTTTGNNRTPQAPTRSGQRGGSSSTADSAGAAGTDLLDVRDVPVVSTTDQPAMPRPSGAGGFDDAADAPPPGSAAPRPGGQTSGPNRRAFGVVALVAALGVLGTLIFGGLYATQSSSPTQNPAVHQSAQAFLSDFFNFNATTVDADFTAVTDMATGPFATQAKQFFNSSIRQALEKAQAQSRGQTRALYVQSETANAATLYAVVDQTYVNNKITTAQADVVHMVINLADVGGTWKISDVTVLEGATPSSEGTTGSAGSSVPGR